MTEKVPSVWAATRILERLAADWPHPVAPSALTSELGLNRSTCYNILGTLQRAGWVSTSGERGAYSLGPSMLRLTGVTPNVLVTVVQEEINALTGRTGLSVYAAQAEPTGEYVVIAAAEPDGPIHVAARVGARLEFSAPALLAAFAAWLPAEQVQKLIAQHGLTKFTEYSTVDRARLAEEFDATRKLGYSRSVRQYNLSQTAVAAPVFDRRSHPILAICALGFASDLDDGDLAAAGAATSAAADRITDRIGGRRPAAVA